MTGLKLLAAMVIASTSLLATVGSAAEQDHHKKMRLIISKATSAYQARANQDSSVAASFYDVGNPDEEMAVREFDKSVPAALFVDSLKKCVFIANGAEGRTISEDDRSKIAEEFAAATLEAVSTSGWEPAFYESESDFVITGDVTSKCSLKIEVGYDLYVLNGYGYFLDY